MEQLAPEQFSRARTLFDGVAAFQLCAASVMDGTAPGQVWVDQVETPRAAFMLTPEGMYLAGAPDNAAFVRALNEHFRTQIYDASEEIDVIWLVYDPPGWGRALSGLLFPRDTLITPRRHYVCRELAINWRDSLPPGFSVRPIDAALLADDTLARPEHISSWITNNWRDQANFLARGFGFCTVDDARQQVVSWSVADCVHGDRCEIGIQTREDYRRRGLATVTVAAAVEYALANGYTSVGWHCHDDNIGSWRLAEKVGFKLERHYITVYAMVHAAMHWAERGWQAFQAGNAAAGAECFEQAFTLQAEMPFYTYLAAARANAASGHADRAVRYAAEAVRRGSLAAQELVDIVEFAALADHPDWVALIEQERNRDA